MRPGIKYGVPVIPAARFGPAAVKAANRNNAPRKLVFLNACWSARGDKAGEMADAFNAKAYVGWDAAPTPAFAPVAGKDFMDALDGGRTVEQACMIARNKSDDARSLTPLRGLQEKIDRKP